MKATFIGDKNGDGPGVITMTVEGQVMSFPKGEAVNVDGRTKLAEHLRGHSHFECKEAKEKAK